MRRRLGSAILLVAGCNQVFGLSPVGPLEAGVDTSAPADAGACRYEPTTFPLPALAKRIGFADVVGTTEPDVIALADNGQIVFVQLDGTTTEFAELVGTPTGLAVGDLDTDGSADFATIGTTGNLDVYLSKDKTFPAPRSSTITPAKDVAIGRFEHADDHPDVASLAAIAKVQVVASPAFTDATDHALTSSGDRIAAGDVTGDGNDDLAVLDVGSARFHLYAQRYDVTAQPPTVTFDPLLDDPMLDMRDYAVAPLGRTAQPGIAIAQGTERRVHVVGAGSEPGTIEQRDIAVGGDAVAIAAGQLDNDALFDLAVGLSSSNIELLRNTGDGFEATGTLPLGHAPLAMAISGTDIAVSLAADPSVVVYRCR